MRSVSAREEVRVEGGVVGVRGLCSGELVMRGTGTLSL